jgi:hypothetical protein
MVLAEFEPVHAAKLQLHYDVTRLRNGLCTQQQLKIVDCFGMPDTHTASAPA